MTYSQGVINHPFITRTKHPSMERTVLLGPKWAPISIHVSPHILKKCSEHGATDGKHPLAGKFSHLFPAVICTSEKESIKATLSHVSTCIFWAAGLVTRALFKVLVTFISCQKKNSTHSSGILGLLVPKTLP